MTQPANTSEVKTELTKEPILIRPEVAAIQQIPIIPTLLDVICTTTGMGFACVARVTDEQWIACGVKDKIAFGINPGGELKLETTICNEIRQQGKIVVIDDVSLDEKFCNHPTPRMYGFLSYISVPITLQNGEFFGTLCAIDPQPARLNNPQIIGMFTLFAELISFHLDTFSNLAAVVGNLQNEQKNTKLRDQFIAILGHDLRNPLGAVLSSAQMIQRLSKEETVLKLAKLVENSASRMGGLISNIMDFASGRLGKGISLYRRDDEPIENILGQVRSELIMVWRDRDIRIHHDLREPVNCDGSRLAQLFSNLLGNALKYGNPEQPIQVHAISNMGVFTLSVKNGGNKIPDDIIGKLFEPFSRGDVLQNQEGLGLGLYIASEIARAHQGQLTVSSSSQETCFTLSFPSKLN